MNITIQQLLERVGTVHLDDLSHLDREADITNIVDDLKQDLLQASFPDGQIIDIGWYPEFCENGSFRVYLIRDHDWEHPVFSRDIKTWAELDSALLYALGLLSNAEP